jgi:phenylacetaldehyde dehydrogenase
MATTVEAASPASAFLAQRKRMLIDGEWVEARHGRTLDVYDPALGEIIDHVPAGDAQDVDLAVAAARRAFEDSDWTRLTASDRGRLMWRIGDLVLEHADGLAQVESLDNGKPVGVDRVADVPLAADLFHYTAGFATKIHGHTFPVSVPYARGAQFHAYTLKEPIGVVGQIIPWNFPLLMAAWKLAPALAIGCTVVLTVAEQTPLSALRLAEIMQEAGLPNGVMNVITGFGETAGAALAGHPGVDKVAFTGSTEVAPAANDTVYGLAAGIWTNDVTKAHRLIPQLKAGDGVGQHLQHLRRRAAVRRLQAVGLGTRDGRRGDPRIHRDQVGVHRALRTQRPVLTPLGCRLERNTPPV